MFRRIKGQDHTIDLLRKAIEHDRVAQAYLFHGSDGVGKFMTALYFGMALNCYALPELRPCGICASCHKFLQFEHPDFTYIFPTPNLNITADGEIKNEDALMQYQAYIQNKINSPWDDFYFKEAIELRKENISLLMKRMELSIHEANFRIVIIEQADLMNTQTANAFLKTLEEPPANTVIILITERLQMILPTIISRTQPIYFKPLSRGVIESILAEQFDTNLVTSKTAARISAGNLKTAIRIAGESKSIARDWAFEIVELAAKHDDLAFFYLLNKYRENHGKEQINELIRYIRIVTADLALLSVSESSPITNIDRFEQLQQIAGSHADLDENAHEYFLGLEDLSRKIDGNVNLNLIIMNLYFRTKSWFNS